MYDIIIDSKCNPMINGNLLPLVKKVQNLSQAYASAKTEKFWFIESSLDLRSFDFSYQPAHFEKDYIFSFSPNDHEIGIRLVSFENNGQVKFVVDKNIKLLSDIYIIDTGNCEVKSSKNKIKRFYNTWTDTIKRCCLDSNFDFVWIISNDIEYPENLIKHYHPSIWDQKYNLIFGNNITDDLHVYYINRKKYLLSDNTVCHDAKYIRNESLSIKPDSIQTFLIDHFVSNDDFHYDNAIKVKYTGDYASTIKKCAEKANTSFIWILSNNCRYNTFDFDWRPLATQENFLHVFSTGNQKFGDTFFVHVNSFLEHYKEGKQLEEIGNIAYHNIDRVDRKTTIVKNTNDSVVDLIRLKPEILSLDEYFLILTDTETISEDILSNPPSVWHEETNNIESYDSGRIVYMPRIAIPNVQSQVYDYPHVKKIYINTLKPMDIIFLSNSEPESEIYYEKLQKSCNNRAKWIKNIDGRSRAYQECARVSETPWYFNVFAKLEVEESFDWDWQPDRLQQAKNYIFYSKNPLNNLTYGHQGMICYNRNLVNSTANLENSHLDFTLSMPHEVIPIVSGTAHFNQNEWMTWRTAFREVIKLIHFNRQKYDIETEYRLNTWLTVASGKFAQWCIQGAQDAKEYYESVNGDHDKLLLSYEWKWLREYYNFKYCS